MEGSAMPKKTCSVEGCENDVLARGWCTRHYYRWRRTGEPGPVESRRITNAGRTCSVDGCDRDAEKLGMCGMHYLRYKKSGDPGPAESTYMPPTPDGKCSIRRVRPGHLRPPTVWAAPPAGAATRRPRPRRADQATARGGRFVDTNGYVRVREPEHANANSDGYILEHRLVMTAMLGRSLYPEETVHHINGIRDDNRPRTSSCGCPRSRTGSAWRTLSPG